jgi:CheY-like chemotaxis protein
VPRTLLLADDSVTIQRVIELTFADEDIRVVAVGDGDQAIARLESAPPDIVLADVGMPGMNGYEVARYVKETPKLSHIPVVLLTGAFEPVDRNRAAAVKCDGVLAKPFEPQIVIGRVKELLAKAPEPEMALSPFERSVPPAVPDGAPAAPSSVDGDPSDPLQSVGGDIDEYFDRLDAAFATLTEASAEPKSAPPVVGHAVPPGAPARASSQFDWFGSNPPESSSSPDKFRAALPATDGEPADLPLSADGRGFAPPDLDVSPSSASEDDPLGPAPALLDAAPFQQTGPEITRLDLEPPVSERAAPAPAPLDLASLVDEVTERVLDRLSDRVGRGMVAEVVTDVAERLVREEIERIKASIK